MVVDTEPDLARCLQDHLKGQEADNIRILIRILQGYSTVLGYTHTATVEKPTAAALTLQTIIESNSLWLGPYTEQQEALYALCMELRDGGMQYTTIAKLLNKQHVKTIRGKHWVGAGVHSVIKKGTIRKDRLSAPPTIRQGETGVIICIGGEWIKREK
ncbi:MAG TPA: hypothetical protein EYN06_00405 [Myxococcales bacterium]|nr:hypothetical protein [Myxococcales bacterium]HIN84909.1 hypothetical protein [Myxococcales bacterium]